MTGRRRARRLIATIGLMLAAACGSSPSSPTMALDVSGNWSGTWSFVTSGVTVTDAVTVTFTQGSTTNGTWTAANGATGVFRFGVASTVSGTMSISQARVGGGTCSSNTSLTGTVSATSMALSVADPPTTTQCNWATNNQFALHR